MVRADMTHPSGSDYCGSSSHIFRGAGSLSSPRRCNWLFPCGLRTSRRHLCDGTCRHGKRTQTMVPTSHTSLKAHGSISTME